MTRRTRPPELVPQGDVRESPRGSCADLRTLQTGSTVGTPQTVSLVFTYSEEAFYSFGHVPGTPLKASVLRGAHCPGPKTNSGFVCNVSPRGVELAGSASASPFLSADNPPALTPDPLSSSLAWDDDWLDTALGAEEGLACSSMERETSGRRPSPKKDGKADDNPDWSPIWLNPARERPGSIALRNPSLASGTPGELWVPLLRRPLTTSPVPASLQPGGVTQDVTAARLDCACASAATNRRNEDDRPGERRRENRGPCPETPRHGNAGFDRAKKKRRSWMQCPRLGRRVAASYEPTDLLACAAMASSTGSGPWLAKRPAVAQATVWGPETKVVHTLPPTCRRPREGHQRPLGC
eukprot:scaffold1074_cov409-Prasinococcus_capsulatus_cf.AAC.9